MRVNMALDSVDLISLLKRARTHISETDTVQDATLDKTVQTSAPGPVARIEEQEEELEDLRAELVGDEVLIQRILGLLYRSKKKNPNSGYISILDMEKILKVEREGASFVMSYMKTQKVLEMDDKSRMAITVAGIVYLRSVVGLQAGPAVAPLSVSETDSAV
jgi:hypothetical protein